MHPGGWLTSDINVKSEIRHIGLLHFTLVIELIKDIVSGYSPLRALHDEIPQRYWRLKILRVTHG